MQSNVFFSSRTWKVKSARSFNSQQSCGWTMDSAKRCKFPLVWPWTFHDLVNVTVKPPAVLFWKAGLVCAALWPTWVGLKLLQELSSWLTACHCRGSVNFYAFSAVWHLPLKLSLSSEPLLFAFNTRVNFPQSLNLAISYMRELSANIWKERKMKKKKN